MSEYACSICQTLLFRCTNYRPTSIKWVLLVCQICAQNGKFKQYAKNTYELTQKVVQQKDAKDKLKVTDDKKQYFKDQNIVLQTLIKPQTFQFAQKYVNFTQNIIKDRPEMVQNVKKCSERIQDMIERQTKRFIIDEVKDLNQNLKKEVQINRANVKRVQELSREIRIQVGNLCFKPNEQIPDQREGLPIFTPEEINSVIVGFNKRVNEMDNKTIVLTKLVQEGDGILVEERIEH